MIYTNCGIDVHNNELNVSYDCYDEMDIRQMVKDINAKVLRLENELNTYKSGNILLKKTLDKVRRDD